MFTYLSCFRKRRFLILVLISLTAAKTLLGQTVPASDVQSTLRRAAVEVERYRNDFRDLLAKEVKTFKIYHKSGSLKKQKVIVSNFLVYDLSTAKNETTEFRNVLSVDGTPVSNSDDRAVALFEKVAKANTTSKELERIQKESLRYDEEIKMFGLTLYQAIGLNEKIRDVMAFDLAGKATVGNSEAYVVKFRQTKPSPYITTNGNPPVGAVLDYEYDGSGPAEATIDGTLWIDSKTYQIVREERKLWVRDKDMSEPALLTSNLFDFDEGGFGIRVPKTISHVEYRVGRERIGPKHIEITYEYSSFTRPDVEVISDKTKN
jgi:hypothetical protein